MKLLRVFVFSFLLLSVGWADESIYVTHIDLSKLTVSTKNQYVLSIPYIPTFAVKSKRFQIELFNTEKTHEKYSYCRLWYTLDKGATWQAYGEGIEFLPIPVKVNSFREFGFY